MTASSSARDEGIQSLPRTARAAGWGSAGSAGVRTYRSAASNVWKEPPRAAVNAVLWPPRGHQHRAFGPQLRLWHVDPVSLIATNQSLEAPRPQSALGWLLTARGRWARSGQVQPDDDVAVVALAGRMRLHPAEEPHRLPAPRGPCSR